MWVAGIDYSTHAVDMVVVDLDGEHPPQWKRVDLYGGDAFDRTRSVRAVLPTSSWWGDVLAVGIEDPRGHNAGALYRVQGAILSRIHPSILVHPLIPSQWRKLVGLPGNASKRDVAMFSLRTHQLPKTLEEHAYLVSDWPQDAHDAHCIALATRTLLEREQRGQPVRSVT